MLIAEIILKNGLIFTNGFLFLITILLTEHCCPFRLLLSSPVHPLILLVTFLFASWWHIISISQQWSKIMLFDERVNV